MLTAFERELALTTACPRLNREESGCSGLVCRKSSTAKARTRGARLVSRTVWEMSSSSKQMGSSSEASSSWGVSSSPGVREGISGLSSCLRRFEEGEFVVGNGAPRLVPAEPPAVLVRFMAALQAFWRDFAVFSSLRADLMVSRGASAICWMLVDFVSEHDLEIRVMISSREAGMVE